MTLWAAPGTPRSRLPLQLLTPGPVLVSFCRLGEWNSVDVWRRFVDAAQEEPDVVVIKSGQFHDVHGQEFDSGTVGGEKVFGVVCGGEALDVTGPGRRA